MKYRAADVVSCYVTPNFRAEREITHFYVTATRKGENMKETFTLKCSTD